MSPHPISPDLLDRYFAAECSAAERATVEAWIAEHPPWSVAAEALGRWSTVEVDTETWLTQVKTPSDDQDVSRTTNVVARPRASFGIRPMRKQLIASSSGRWTTFGNFAIAIPLTIAVVIGVGRLQRSAKPQPQSVTTAIGERRMLTLASGTRITLAPQSQLTIRGVELDLIGEAYFTVQPKSATPLIVHTGSIATRVLGTIFDVRRYPADSTTRVVVTEGKVSTGGTHTTVVTAGHVAQVTDSIAEPVLTDDAASYTNWTKGEFVFHNVPTREVLETLGHWYGLEFHVSDPALMTVLVNLRFTNQSAMDVLTVLRDVLNVTVTVDGKVVTLSNTSVRRVPSIRRRSAQIFSTPNREAGR